VRWRDGILQRESESDIVTVVSRRHNNASKFGTLRSHVLV